MADSFPDWAKVGWCLYDDTNGNVKLKHYWPQDEMVQCPNCNKPLGISKANSQYNAQCCKKTFNLSWNHVTQKEPTGTHMRKTGRGWQTLRLQNKSDIEED